ncbi:MAG: phospholipid carrier-dependent glycosyltransferase [Candidatus Omnitrophica bacterium]|nr:phospholipid carrier-dependent glycosyltransferase [Candidatus Omnitrophota bacterium]
MRLLKILLFVSAVLFLFFFMTSRIPLWSSDEGRYGELARSIYDRGDLAVTQFNGMDYLEKPVLAPILTAGAYALFGVSSFSARFVSIISALAGIWVCWLFVRRLWNRPLADLSALILATSVGYVLVGRFAVIDMLMTFLMSSSILFMMTAYFEKRRGFYLAAYALMGFAFLTKGLIAFVLPGLIFLVFLICVKDLGEILRMKLVMGAIIITAIILPWILAVSRREPEFFEVFIVKHHLQRFATNTFGRAKPVWFYVPILFATFFPWSLFLFSAVMRAVRTRGEAHASKLKFLLVWAGVIFVFFSFPRAKLPYYLLPLSMPLAILLAHFFEAARAKITDQEAIEKRAAEWSWKAAASSGALLFLVLNPVLYFLRQDPEIDALRPLAFIGTALIMTGMAGVYRTYRSGKLVRAVGMLGGLTYLTLIFAVIGMKIISPYQSTHAFAEVLRGQLRPEDRVAVYSSPDHFSDFMFHLQRRVIVVGSDRGTLTEESAEPDHKEESQLWFFEDQHLVREFKNPSGRFYLLLDEDNLPKLESYGIAPYRMLLHEGRKILISNETSLAPVLKGAS